MQAYRTHSVVHNGQVVVQLPEGFENTDVEIIVLKSSPARNGKSSKKGKFDKYFGILKSGLSIEEIDAQLKLLRDEWDRPIY
jgi:hypothetical protein